MTNNSKQHLKYWYLSLILTAAGFLVSLYSAYSHYKNYTDVQYSSFCSLSQAINCDTVAQSHWSIFGGLPLAWWGVLFFLSFFVVLMIEKQWNIRSWQYIFRLTLAVSFFSLLLAILSIWKIHSLCLLCLATYIITFSLTFTCWLITKRLLEKINNINDRQPNNAKTLKCFGIGLSLFVAGLISLYAFLPTYWTDKFSSDTAGIAHGTTEDGHPWIGALNPSLTIVQFSDYQCFQCAKMHFFIRRLLQSHPDTLRLVHRNYPMDHTVNPQVVPQPFHEGSGDLAKLAILASLRNTFWEMNDLLYSITRKKVEEVPLKELAEATGLDAYELAAALQNPTIQELLRRDIWRGMKLGITGTPAFLIEGNVYQGHIPKKVLKQISSLPAQ